MSIASSSPSVGDLQQQCQSMARAAKAASFQLAQLNGAAKDAWLRESARQLRANSDEILKANQQDIQAAPDYGLTSAQIDRLQLSAARIDGIAQGLEEIAMLAHPIGQVIESNMRPNGLEVRKVRVPLGVVFFIYESRPNVTADAAAICVKSGNAVILRGGKEAAHSSRAIVNILRLVASETGIPADAVQLVATTDRAAVGHFLSQGDLIDVTIPRGGEGLIRRVAREATMPVIKHFDGNCHVYVDAAANLDMAERIVVNSKCQRLGVCNACESMLIHAAIAGELLPRLGEALASEGVEVRGCDRTCELIPTARPAAEEDYRTEYLAPTISAKVVESVSAAIDHINQYGSHHTDAIVTESLNAAESFSRGVDSAAVMVNASTRFNDGFEFGLGAEIGISTDKFHARGPCGLNELTSYKYVVQGNGQEKI